MRRLVIAATAVGYLACFAFLTVAAFRPDLVASRLMEIMP